VSIMIKEQGSESQSNIAMVRDLHERCSDRWCCISEALVSVSCMVLAWGVLDPPVSIISHCLRQVVVQAKARFSGPSPLVKTMMLLCN
jgi:hypothetical protein